MNTKRKENVQTQVKQFNNVPQDKKNKPYIPHFQP